MHQFLAGMLSETIDDMAMSIAVLVHQQDATTQEIVRNVAPAATGTVEITGNIVDVARASEETGAVVTRLLSAACELSRQSEYLSMGVARFPTTVRVA